VLFYDNNLAGIRGMLRIGKWLSRSVSNLTVWTLPSWAEQPDDLNKLGLGETFNARERFEKWKRQTTLPA